MKALVQRVSRASVEVEGRMVASVGPGLLVLLGVARGDGPADALSLAGRTSRLRVFEDAGRKMNRSLLDTGGEALVVSQFTLLADASRGNRPGFEEAAAPEEAEPLYGAFCAALAERGVPVSTGLFRAEMRVSLVNDGPVTLMLESRGR